MNECDINPGARTDQRNHLPTAQNKKLSTGRGIVSFIVSDIIVLKRETIYFIAWKIFLIFPKDFFASVVN